MTNVEALKNLYVALGGNEADVANLTINADVIEAMADVCEAVAGAVLPAVTDADDGKVLTVVNGAWKAV